MCKSEHSKESTLLNMKYISFKVIIMPNFVSEGPFLIRRWYQFNHFIVSTYLL